MDCCCIFNLPTGFRFHPTDEELVHEYLLRKCADLPLPAPIAADVDLYKFDPWDLPAMAAYGEKEWYFFSPRDRKYPNGSRPDRAAACGHWRATGIDKPIGKPKALGIKKGLVFYVGKSPQGIKTNWIMHEYRVANVDRRANVDRFTVGEKRAKRLDDWVLCKIYNKKGEIEKYTVGEPSAMPSIEQLPNPQRGTSLSLGSSEAQTVETSESVPKLRGESIGSDHRRSVPECSEGVRGESEWEEFEEELEKGLGFSMEDFLDDNDIFEEETENNQIMDEFPPVPDPFPFPRDENTQQKPF